ncbi:MAG: hypothetical protein UU35_C0003G0003 [Candidatus Uhrbacteria bacterium GW2011_GWC2_41_11]|uniref:Dockerin domain-containing protein n=1 Tax=Candidatus Uhrbacteria bacterium GW2011_GWC2_41_11 TaxID=1618985 RepID=A0A0G0XI54_9BACT|nr:MAG: hypothetical protein UU35_C0003G0003 [Candidatus Uhrbacteria bacterium GW2011_GWC2_41_11]HBP00055.1 hypothetical protein [Candidatus Uhrbacteria bacterium]
MHMKNRFLYPLSLLVLLTFPLMSVRATSSTNFEIEPTTDGTSATHTSTSASFSVDGAIGSISGRGTSASFIIESGASSGGVCGDGFVDPDEDCDSGDMNGGTCDSEGFDSGTLTCDVDCTYDTSDCEEDEDGGGGGGSGGGGVASSTLTTPTLSSSLNADKSDEGKLISFDNTVLLYGSRSSGSTVLVNGSSEGVTYPTSTSWQAIVILVDGDNSIRIVAKSSSGRESTPTTVVVSARDVGDVNGDSEIDDYDLSLLVHGWNSGDPESDFNEDGMVNDYDFSMLVSRWLV